MSLVIVGSVAFDTIETPAARRERIVGGSCSYCALAASYFTRPKIVGVVGEDFPAETIAFFRKRRIDLKGLRIVPGGKTFFWQGRYGCDPNERETIQLDLNVFARDAGGLDGMHDHDLWPVEPFRCIIRLFRIAPEIEQPCVEFVGNVIVLRDDIPRNSRVDQNGFNLLAVADGLQALGLLVEVAH